MKAPDLVKALKNGDEIFVIDVRTPKETAVYSVYAETGTMRTVAARWMRKLMVVKELHA